MSSWTVTAGRVRRRDTWEEIGRETTGRVEFILLRCKLCRRRACCVAGDARGLCCCQGSR